MTDYSPTFGDDMTCRHFQEACKEYAEWAVRRYDIFDDVNLDEVTIEVSKKLKRAAGKAGESKRARNPHFMRFAYGAYQKWGWGDEIESTIRHELIHIVQYQETGRGGHGYNFKRMANKVDCEVHCKQFTDFNYGVYCSQCDELVAGRYRDCKLTRNAEKYRSKCCSAKCYSEEL